MINPFGIFWIVFLMFLNATIICKGSSNLTQLSFQCDDWKYEYPEENGVTNMCNMTVKDGSEFMFLLRKSEFKGRLIRLNVIFEEIETFKTKCVVEPKQWVWTFPGEKGATHFLKWPQEYRVWSLGLLDSRTFGPVDIRITVQGNCPVIIGQNETTQRIGLALLQMANKASDLPGANVEYGYGYVCYHERVYIDSPFMYSLCLHIICPFEALGYRCCNTIYEIGNNKTRVVCDGEVIHYDEAWWIVPFIIGILMFANVPLLLVKPFQKQRRCKGFHTIDLLQSGIYNEDWLIANPLSFCRIIRSPFIYFGEKFPRMAGVILRFLVTMCSVLILIIQILVHYNYDYKYTLDLVKAGVPLAFRSMVTGYHYSKHNFMPRLGGPYVGLAFYLITTAVLVCLPRDLETFIDKGIPNNVQLSVSPITIDLKTRGKLGAVFDIERQHGYQKIYSLMKAHIFMLINPSFWKLAIQMQLRRFLGLLNIATQKKSLKVSLLVVLFIPYFFVFCVAELLLAVTYYGFPIFLFFQVTVCAYCKEIKTIITRFGVIGNIIRYLLTLSVVGLLVFNIYILTVVFVDSFHFITRVIMFTFTGLIAYPGTTYGYFVFAITILMYVMEAIQHIRTGYSKLFNLVRKCCMKIHNNNSFPNISLIKQCNGFNVISRELFFFVVSRHRPIRVEIFFSFLKLVFITFLMYLAIHTIVKLQGLWDINPLTQVVTALFICLIPKLWHKMMTRDEFLVDMREAFVIQKLIADYCRQKLYTREHKINADLGNGDQENQNEHQSLLGGNIDRGYYSIASKDAESEDDEMRADLLLDLANEL